MAKGLASPLDGGGGVLVWDQSRQRSGDDGGTVFAPTSPGVGAWVRHEAIASGRFNVRWFGALGDGIHDDAPAINAAFLALARIQQQTPDGVYLGAGVVYFPRGVYLCHSIVNCTPMVYSNISQHISVVGDGMQASILVFDRDNTGVLATDYPGGNTSSNVHVRDLGLYNASASNGHAGLFYQGAADCVIERCRIAGFAAAVDMLDCNTMTVRDVVFAGCASGVPASAGSIGVALRGSANQARVRDCQFNGPGINVLHGAGAGHFVSGCNSEGGILGKFVGAVVCVHEGWTTEGQDATSTPYLFFFDDQGSPANVFVARSVVLRDCFLGGSSTRDIVRFAPQATMSDFGWERMVIAAAPSAGVVRIPVNHMGGTCYSIGAKVSPLAEPLFDHTPAQYKDLTA